ncbi:MAG: hypothetical protein P4M00_11190 [Azospirillaceae bacterium]|nr:hypothetical protein [Azospirillaceae bacterium]
MDSPSSQYKSSTRSARNPIWIKLVVKNEFLGFLPDNIASAIGNNQNDAKGTRLISGQLKGVRVEIPADERKIGRASAISLVECTVADVVKPNIPAYDPVGHLFVACVFAYDDMGAPLVVEDFDGTSCSRQTIVTRRSRLAIRGRFAPLQAGGSHQAQTKSLADPSGVLIVQIALRTQDGKYLYLPMSEAAVHCIREINLGQGLLPESDDALVAQPAEPMIAVAEDPAPLSAHEIGTRAPVSKQTALADAASFFRALGNSEGGDLERAAITTLSKLKSCGVTLPEMFETSHQVDEVLCGMAIDVLARRGQCSDAVKDAFLAYCPSLGEPGKVLAQHRRR